MPGCCGGGGVTKKKSTPAQVARAAQVAMDVQSMTLVEYVGRNHGSQRWGGPGGSPSKKTYVFGRNDRDRVRYVDERDVKWLLGVQSEGYPVFRIYKPVEQKPVQPTMPTPVEPDTDFTTGEVKIDPSEMTIAEIKEMELSPELWQQVLDAEINGKNRTGAIEFIKTKMFYAQSV